MDWLGVLILCVGSWLGGTWQFFLLVWLVVECSGEGELCVCACKIMRLKRQEEGRWVASYITLPFDPRMLEDLAPVKMRVLFPSRFASVPVL